MQESCGQGSQQAEKTLRVQHRVVRARALTEVADPPFADVQAFVRAAVGGSAAEAERALLSAATSSTARHFAVGDTVMVAKGDLKSMKARVVEVDQTKDRVHVMPILQGFNEKLDFAMDELQKHVETGSRVKVRPPPSPFLTP
jgi:transcription antitermination factor NusG